MEHDKDPDQRGLPVHHGGARGVSGSGEYGTARAHDPYHREALRARAQGVQVDVYADMGSYRGELTRLFVPANPLTTDSLFVF